MKMIDLSVGSRLKWWLPLSLVLTFAPSLLTAQDTDAEWLKRKPALTSTGNAVTFTGESLVAVGEGGKVSRSENGSTGGRCRLRCEPG